MSGRNLAINVKVGEHHEWHIAGVTLNADTIVATLIAGAIIVLLGVLLRRSISARQPGRLQLFFETVVQQVERQV
jgi:F-type H+-transporting ATPase subunit a